MNDYIVTCEIKLEELYDPYLSDSDYPLIVKVRSILESAGFKFEDSGLLSSAINTNPIPLGVFSNYIDDKTRTIHYKQKIPKERL